MNEKEQGRVYAFGENGGKCLGIEGTAVKIPTIIFDSPEIQKISCGMVRNFFLNTKNLNFPQILTLVGVCDDFEERWESYGLWKQ